MNIFLRGIKKLFGKDEASRIKKLNDRIYQLRQEKSNLTKELKNLKATPASDLSWFKIHISVPLSKLINAYRPHQLGEVRTMMELFEKREQEEEERKLQLKNYANKCFNNIRSYLGNEDVKSAESLLFNIAPNIKEIKDDGIQENFESLKWEIVSLKETLFQHEIDRKKREEEEHKRRERERLERIRQKEIEEQQRLKKEREAKEYEEKLTRETQARVLEVERLRAEVTEKKDNAQAYINYLKSHNVTCFYHFTDENNLPSIKRLGGLYSWYYCENNGIKIPNAGGDNLSRDLDRRQSLEDYVRLSFCSDHPMAYRMKQAGSNLVLLRIKIDVAAFKDTQFSNMNAATNGNSHGEKLEDLQRVNIHATKSHYVSRNDGEIFAEHQAECMVKTFIPIEYITNINDPLFTLRIY